jgi:putative flippase GtrA
MWQFVRASARAFSPKVLQRFFVVGGTASALYFGISWLLAAQGGTGEVVATSVAFVAVIVWNYVMHYHWTFESEQAHSIAGARFCVMSAVGFFLNWLVIGIGTDLLPGSPLLVKLVAVGFVVLSNLIISALWVFGTGRGGRRIDPAAAEQGE